MELYQRKTPDGDLLSPFWYYDVTVDGKRVRRSTKEKVKQKAQRVMVDALRTAEEAVKAGPRVPTLREALEGYVAGMAAREKVMRSAVFYAAKVVGDRDWKGRVFTLDGSRPVSSLTRADIDRLKLERSREGAKPATVALELRVLRAAINRHGGGVRLDLKWDIATARGKVRWLSREEWKRVYDEMDPDRLMRRSNGPADPPEVVRDCRLRARDLFVALTLCGGRWGEVTRLTVDQVIPGDPTQLKLYGWKTKEPRYVPVPPAMAEVLLRRSRDAEAEGRMYLFPGLHRDYIVRSDAIRQAMDRAGLNAPHIVERFGNATIHSLRHTFASWLRQKGMGLGEIGKMLGHSNEATTTIYAHIAMDATVAAAATVLTDIVGEDLAA